MSQEGGSAVVKNDDGTTYELESLGGVKKGEYSQVKVTYVSKRGLKTQGMGWMDPEHATPADIPAGSTQRWTARNMFEELGQFENPMEAADALRDSARLGPQYD